MSDKLKVIDRDIIKYIALIPMALGHFTGYLFGTEINTGALFIIYLLTNMAVFAPPIFFFFIAEGFHYTRSRKKYAVRLLVFAFINQVPFLLINCGTVFTVEALNLWNIFFTLFLGLVCLCIWESGLKKPVKITLIALIDVLTCVIMSEWMVFGIPIMLGFHIFRDKPKKRFIWFIACITAHTLTYVVFNMWQLENPRFSLSFVIMFIAMLLGYLTVTFFYSGKKGKHPVFSKWFFYIFYPAHLFGIYIAMLVTDKLPA